MQATGFLLDPVALVSEYGIPGVHPGRVVNTRIKLDQATRPPLAEPG
jgi:hypothetical protein